MTLHYPGLSTAVLKVFAQACYTESAVEGLVLHRDPFSISLNMFSLNDCVAAIANQPRLRSLLDRGFLQVGLSSAWERLLSRCVMSSSALRQIPRRGTQVIQVVGTPRSGSTLLATMLNAHSQVACLLEPYLAWLKHGKYEYDWKEIGGSDAERFSRQQPHRLFSFLCSHTELNVVGFKETFRTPYHPTFPSQSFLEKNHATGAVNETVAIVRDPRDTWSSVVRRHPNFRGDTTTMAELVYAWNELCDWIRREDITVVRYENLVSKPKEIDSVLESIGLSEERKVHRPEGMSGYGDSRAREGGDIDDTSVRKYKNTLSSSVTRFIEAWCSENMKNFNYN